MDGDSNSPNSKLNNSNKIAKSVRRHVKKKITRNVQLSEDSNISEQSAYIKKKTTLVDWIREFKDYNFDNPLMVNTLESVFLKMAVLKPHKLKYYKLLGEDAGKFEIWDYIMTEESIMQGFESVFGVKCDIVAKILYINLSKMCDYV